MSTLAAALKVRVRGIPHRPPEVALRLTAFFALAMFCAAHYSVLVADANPRRIVALVLVATAGGAALAMTNERWTGAWALPGRIALALVTFAAALIVTGLQARLLLPGHWDELRDGLDRGFSGLSNFTWPYEDGDPWTRLTLLLGMPLLIAPAAVLAFWPARKSTGVFRWFALALLLTAYGTGTTQLGLGGWALRGAALLVVVAAYIWLPKLPPRDTVPAALAVIGCGLLALPLAAGFDRDTPWLDYRAWNWFERPAAGTVFQWDHSYGPIHWSRSGIPLLAVTSKEPHYWKAETLDRFDGTRWFHENSRFNGGDAAQDIPPPLNERWVEQIDFRVRQFKSPVVVGAGTTFRVHGAVTSDQSDGTIRMLDGELTEGDSYSIDAYIPDPTAVEMRAAPQHYPLHLIGNTAIQVPQPKAGSRTVQAVSPGQGLSAGAESIVLQSPYARVYRLARRLAANQSTTYDTVKSIESYLAKGYDYSEKPPLRRYPLVSFLFDDKIGYCQQFSGAMALMLRMNGIPARVSAGFTPGAFDHEVKEYRVRDLDAHSWVEVWFSDIGWVPFDPTPSLSPASSQSDSASAASAARGAAADRGATDAQRRLREGATGSGDAGSVSSGPDSHWWLLGLGVLIVVPLAVVMLWIVGAIRRRPHPLGRHAEAVDELRDALDRLGYQYPARTTLAELERRLRVTAGPAAAHYVELLRDERYARPGTSAPPTAADRRALRRALTEGGGPLARLRGLVALPPRFSAG